MHTTTTTSRPASGTTQPSTYSIAILLGLGAKTSTGGNVYEGTADPNRVAKRRAANRVARASRRINRRRAAR